MTVKKLQESVWVKLSESGERHLKAHKEFVWHMVNGYVKLSREDFEKVTFPIPDDNGWSRFTLGELMAIFGSYRFNERGAAFEGDEVHTSKPLT